MPSKTVSANQLIEDFLREHLGLIEKACDADCMTFVGPIIFGIDDAIRSALENIDNKRKKLAFVLETSGGYAETVRRIVDTLRHHYEIVDFIVPSYAMSAGTILVMSGDAIFMDYYSVLGPIDPQIESDDGKLIPALGYLIRYEELLDKANQGKITTAEMEVLLNFDQGRLYSYEQARDLSKTLLEEWLVKYKFENWMETESTHKPVTSDMKKNRARDIADKLNDVKRWNSHGIGINMERLRRDLNLKIDDFGASAALNEPIRNYHKLLSDYMAKVGVVAAIHTKTSFEPLII